MKKMRRGFALAMASAMVLLTAWRRQSGSVRLCGSCGHPGDPGPGGGQGTGAAADTTAAAQAET